MLNEKQRPKKGPRGAHVGRKRIKLSCWGYMEDPRYKNFPVAWEDVWAYYRDPVTKKEVAYGPCIIGIEGLKGDLADARRGQERNKDDDKKREWYDDDVAKLSEVFDRINAGENYIVVENDHPRVPNVYIQGPVTRDSANAYFTHYFKSLGFKDPKLIWKNKTSNFHFYPSYTPTDEEGNAL